VSNLGWIPIGTLTGFLIGFGVPITVDLLPLLAVACLVLGLFLLSTAGLLER
jgi:uncharacterized membrane protein (Fun14 family)